MGEEIRMTHNVLKVMKTLYDDLDGEHYALALGKATELNPGTLYPLLDSLEDAGFIKGEWEMKPQGRHHRFFYRLSAEGIRHFEAYRAALGSLSNAEGRTAGI